MISLAILRPKSDVSWSAHGLGGGGGCFFGGGGGLWAGGGGGLRAPGGGGGFLAGVGDAWAGGGGAAGGTWVNHDEGIAAAVAPAAAALRTMPAFPVLCAP